jgi:hypothetical protein
MRNHDNHQINMRAKNYLIAFFRKKFVSRTQIQDDNEYAKINSLNKLKKEND